ncbi:MULTISPECIES: alanine/glycine:cation symporter family protein [Staphylococcus]|uniref:Sodium:alanine symporter family protein n=1 Tax=Staphylococcus nepalensis TaxID=214473 RepID=A0ABS3L266_9STAP|nr:MULTISPECIES: sodium:alanine symporter family protein [Staphylococcus]ATH61130.1 amino acid carrier protein [Staphylococcus nepalensis]ATH66160.1 amino acid carrier protein [Staphylococcus nepalensis]MBO1205921.1 sodium:alanine symporter family protein [Staphylococcus nepalensis]MBO1214581.1 sodium:alanine symporter family protein [Staphylococcus nepalensis]MBO1216614.1 sodium:alanine symporter family protein [Staphylococcus nepalensis]
MEKLVSFSDWLWGYPLVLLLLFASVFLTINLKFLQFRHFFYMLKQTFGSVNQKPKGEGTITPRQALTSALSSTVGAANIVGVPTAIMMGGPGAVFWMMVIAFLGMALKFSENVLGVHYREKNKKGEFVGGPTYYMKKGFKNKKLGAIFSLVFAFALMIEIVPSIMVQGHSAASTMHDTFNIHMGVSGVVLAILAALVVFGGVKRIASFAEKIVPIMVGLYCFFGFLIILMNIGHVPNVILLVVEQAFNPTAAVGGTFGAALATTIRWGFARGIYSNEAGLGTSSIAHAAAKTDHPVRQAFWGISEIVVDTLLICSTTAFVVLVSGVWKANDAKAQSAALTARAFENSFGEFGSMMVSISMMFFVFSTVIVVIFYGSRMAEFLFGLTAGWIMKGIYVLSMIVGALGAAQQLWDLLDLALAVVLIPNVIAVLMLSPKVKSLTTDFFKNYK